MQKEKNEQKVFVLLSGGLDSTTLLYHVRKKHSYSDSIVPIHSISIDYGQKHNIETKFAKIHAEKLGTFETLKMPSFDSVLTNEDRDVPNITYAEIEGVSPMYVPFRNGLMLSILAAKAQEWVNSATASTQISVKRKAFIYYGAHAEDASNWAYPDCTPEFIKAMQSAINIGTYFNVELEVPFMHYSKSEIIAEGFHLNVPFELTWSCYKGGDKHCGICATCQARKQAFKEADIEDPTDYEV